MVSTGSKRADDLTRMLEMVPPSVAVERG